MVDSPSPTISEFRAVMDKVAVSGAPGLRGFAAWLADQPEELAFHSVRGLAELAGTDPNTVVRTIKAAGFPGFAAARRSVQQALRRGDQDYVARVDALQQIAPASLRPELSEAALRNVRRVHSRPLWDRIEAIAPQLVAARRVHCIGVRMAYGLAHYFTYRGGIAHGNIVPTPSQPGLIFDSLIETDERDIVIVISFAHYSAEVVRAAAVARGQGARILALTDRHDSPLVEGAWQVLRAPIEGPNVMFSIVGATLIIETLLELMAGHDEQSKTRIERFETGLMELGTYTRSDAGKVLKRS